MRSHRQVVSLLCAAIAILAASSALGQSADTGSVAGHVYCADTQKPARFANVRLQPVEAQEARFGIRFGRGGGFATTGSDGSFRITGVAPGEYYADVMMPGYIQPLRWVLHDLQNLPTADRDQVTAQLTRVNVAANQTANAQVTIYRGGTLGGTVSFDDGAPAAGVAMQAFLLPRGSAQAAASTQQPIFSGFAQTDDRGQFRITGLADGTYIVFAAPRSIFPIYYGNTIDRSSAKKVGVHAGDEVPGTDIQIPVNGMHRLSGVVVSQQDGHALARASVMLRLASGSAAGISVTTASDGTFTFNAVPDGKFTVQLANAYDPNTHAAYTSPDQALEVNGTDVTDLIVNATPETSTAGH